jgi:hypothetical protein
MIAISCIFITLFHISLRIFPCVISIDPYKYNYPNLTIENSETGFFFRAIWEREEGGRLDTAPLVFIKKQLRPPVGFLEYKRDILVAKTVQCFKFRCLGNEW